MIPTNKKEALWIGKRTDKYHYTYICSNCRQKSKFRKSPCEPVWASEIEEFPIAVTKKHFPEEERKEG